MLSVFIQRGLSEMIGWVVWYIDFYSAFGFDLVIFLLVIYINNIDDNEMIKIIVATKMIYNCAFR